MVSPCKNATPSNQIKFGVQCNKKTKPTTVRGTKIKAPKLKRKPYSKKVFYLDLKSSKESTKLQTSLNNLGGTIAVFLDKSVTHLVTDRLGPSTSVGSPAASVSPLPTPSPSTLERPILPKSRALAMLERATHHATTTYTDPIQLANQWNIHVLPLAILWRDIFFLEASRENRRRNCIKSSNLENHFIKIESVLGNRKPDLLKLINWPVLNLDCPFGQSPFQWTDDGVNEKKRTLPELFNLLPINIAKDENRRKIYVEAKNGIMTRRPYKNSSTSDEDSSGANINNKSSTLCNGHSNRHSSQEDLKVQCNGLSSSHRSAKLLSPSGSDVLPLPSQRRSTRRASASWCGSTRELAQLSPTDSELGVTLRPKGTLWLPVALIGTTAEEHGNGLRPRKKKLSPEEKLLQDNKEYFKMEVLNTKLRSTGSLLNLSKESTQPQIDKIILKKVKGKSRNNKWTKTKDLDCIEDNVDYESLIVENKIMTVNGIAKKPKRPRRSELMKLCDEAESFMFGETSRQSAVSEDDKKDDASLDSSCWDETKQRRKRRSHAEAFIHDNIDYYKFETPGSRLRNQGSTCESETKWDEAKQEIDSRTILFSFQTVPSDEPWFNVYARQDEGREVHFPVISDPANQPFLLPYELPRPVFHRSEVGDYYAKRRKRIAQIIAQNHPRKSPRCHASTLAILSSLKRRKRKSSATDPEASPKKQPEAFNLLSDDEVEELSLLDPDDPKSEPNRRKKKTEDRMALKSVDPIVTIETAQRSQPTVDVLDMIERFRFDNDLVDPEIVASLPDHGRVPKRRRKWRKVNRTGWDKEKKRRIKPRNHGIEAVNIVTSPRRPRPSLEDQSATTVTTPCPVRVRKTKNYCRKLVFKNRKRSVTDYSWTSNKR